MSFALNKNNRDVEISRKKEKDILGRKAANMPNDLAHEQSKEKSLGELKIEISKILKVLEENINEREINFISNQMKGIDRDICDSDETLVDFEEFMKEEEYKESKKNRGNTGNRGGDNASEDIAVPSVVDMIKDIDSVVIGQEKAKADLCLEFRKHLQKNWSVKSRTRTFKKTISQSVIDVEERKSNLIMMGDTGTGKTLLAQSLADSYNVPMVVLDATSYTQPGYKGAEPSQIVQELYFKASENPMNTERGIIFLDEIDKLRYNKGGHADDNTFKRSLQQSLLKIIEGTEVNIFAESKSENRTIVDSSNILFIGCGAFIGIEDIIRKRMSIGERTLGFVSANKVRASGYAGSSDKNKKEVDRESILKHVIPEDLVSYGFLPEFIGRMPSITYTDSLTVDILERILREAKNSEVLQCQKFFAYDGIKLEFSDCALKEIANQAWELKLGARGLKTIVNKVVRDYYTRSPYIPEVITIDREYVLEQLDLEEKKRELSGQFSNFISR